MVGGVILSFAFGFEVFLGTAERGPCDGPGGPFTRSKTELAFVGCINWDLEPQFFKISHIGHHPLFPSTPLLSAHLQQVDMESNGKLIDQKGKFVDFETGPVLWGAVRDQCHSIPFSSCFIKELQQSLC